jgi:hypothetical protein
MECREKAGSGRGVAGGTSARRGPQSATMQENVKTKRKTRPRRCSHKQRSQCGTVSVDGGHGAVGGRKGANEHGVRPEGWRGHTDELTLQWVAAGRRGIRDGRRASRRKCRGFASERAEDEMCCLGPSSDWCGPTGAAGGLLSRFYLWGRRSRGAGDGSMICRRFRSRCALSRLRPLALSRFLLRLRNHSGDDDGWAGPRGEAGKKIQTRHAACGNAQRWLLDTSQTRPRAFYQKSRRAGVRVCLRLLIAFQPFQPKRGSLSTTSKNVSDRSPNFVRYPSAVTYAIT